MTNINYQYALASAQGDSRLATGKIAIAHSTATPDALALNISRNMKNDFNNAYVHFNVDDANVYQVGTPGYVAWGAGAIANPLAPIQVELCEFSDRSRALSAYRNYVNLLREQCLKYGIPLTLDTQDRAGVKTHNWISHNLGGTTHVDPISYMNSIGISQAQFAQDLKNGLNTSTTTVKTTSTKTVASNSGINWITESGKFTITTSAGIKLRSSRPSTTATLIAVLPKGSVVNYNAFCYSGGYVWIRQPRDNGFGYLPTGNAVGTTRKDYWGTFS
ncbi:SH3 domain-containing protein [Lacticaseibacillus sp. N501-2]|uniref:SH3 domain-containing protein n=1 Tax=Lacticaseibacillus salsurae TaxID=3367729 RepID=UPI0038B2506C